ncbi:MAG: arsenosugar biosynthesis radical SAM (seleno)protein ArsS [Candidatus Binatia bacterium]
MKALSVEAAEPDFEGTLRRHDVGPLRREQVRTLQVNVGKLCNQACHHCHVDAGPKRTEIMTRATAERVIALLADSPTIETVDLTGGAPELNPNFTFLVERARALSRHVIVRCNLTVILSGGLEWLPHFYRDNEVELVCSLPCYTAENVDRQRGPGVFDKSIEALRLLNRLGYGRPGSPFGLNLVYNPLGAFLPPSQLDLEAHYREELARLFGIEFHRLLTITNMPIKRFAEQLHRWGKFDDYMGVLVNHFNPRTVAGLMCRTLVSVGWDGTLYDCDFNQMLELPIARRGGTVERPLALWDLTRLDEIDAGSIRTAPHCFGCTAGTGSSCGGALA